MKTRNESRYVSYALTPFWYRKIMMMNPSSHFFEEKLIDKSERTWTEDVCIGYHDVVEYMMANDGEYPPIDVPCHGETEPVEVTETTVHMHQTTASLVKAACLESNGFEAFCHSLVANGVDIASTFNNVKKIYAFKEISVRQIPKKMFSFPSNVRVNRPRFWMYSEIKSTTPYIYDIVFLVQPNRYKRNYLCLHYVATDVIPTNKKFFIVKFDARDENFCKMKVIRSKKFFITDVKFSADIVVPFGTEFYLISV